VVICFLIQPSNILWTEVSGPCQKKWGHIDKDLLLFVFLSSGADIIRSRL
jgi:hypothetical protein